MSDDYIDNYWERQEEQLFLPKKFDCPTLISFSGGRTSGYMLYKILESYGGKLPEDVHVVFANTGKEIPQTLDFIRDCETNWNVKVHWLELEIHEERPIYRTKEVNYETASREGEPFEALIKRKKMLQKLDSGVATFVKDSSYAQLVSWAKLEAKQTEMFSDDGRSCFCHD